MIASIIILAVLALIILIIGSLSASKGLNVQHIKKIYLYLVSVIALVIMVIGGIILINMALKTWVFTKADNNFYLDTYRCSQATTEPTTEKPVTPTCTAEQEEKQRKEQEEQKTANKQRDAAQATAMILVATPVWYFHWRLAKREV